MDSFFSGIPWPNFGSPAPQDESSASAESVSGVLGTRELTVALVVEAPKGFSAQQRSDSKVDMLSPSCRLGSARLTHRLEPLSQAPRLAAAWQVTKAMVLKIQRGGLTCAQRGDGER